MRHIFYVFAVSVPFVGGCSGHAHVSLDMSAHDSSPAAASSRSDQTRTSELAQGKERHGGSEQCRLPFGGPPIHLTASLDEQLDDLHMATAGSADKGRFPSPAVLADVGTFLQ